MNLTTPWIKAGCNMLSDGGTQCYVNTEDRDYSDLGALGKISLNCTVVTGRMGRMVVPLITVKKDKEHNYEIVKI